MPILVKVYATLRRHTGGESTLYIEGAETVHALLEMIGVPEAEVKNVMVNGRRREHDYTLTDGDRVALFPPIAGG
ncbi:MAG TPA: MoaD/ThiS family protein [Candidatus Bathyarchaeia archaeon]